MIEWDGEVDRQHLKERKYVKDSAVLSINGMWGLGTAQEMHPFKLFL